MQSKRLIVLTLLLAIAGTSAGATIREISSADLRRIVSAGDAISLKSVVASVAASTGAEPIEAQTALVIAVIGLVVNLVSAWLLHGAQGGHGHDHGHHDDHDHAHHGHAHAHDDHGHQDLNLRAAYAHVMADALTSVFAIAALSAAVTPSPGSEASASRPLPSFA